MKPVVPQQVFVMRSLILIVLIEKALAGVLDQCSVTYARCCNTEFLLLANPDRGFDFTDTRINETCMTAQTAFECLDDFKGMCTNKALLDAVDKAHHLMSDFCVQDTPFQTALRNQKCLNDNSNELKECLAENAVSLYEGLKYECCKYKYYRECAVKIISRDCPEVVQEHAKNYVFDITGLGYEQVCEEYLPHCNSICLISNTWLLFVGFALNFVIY